MPDVTASGEVPRGEKMLYYSGTDPASYIIL